jgi:hypothetical protein
MEVCALSDCFLNVLTHAGVDIISAHQQQKKGKILIYQLFSKFPSLVRMNTKTEH